MVDATQAWFWTSEWQAGEREVDADRDAGRIETFGSAQDFLDALGARADDRAGRRRKR
jgi:hypothetical protein